MRIVRFAPQERVDLPDLTAMNFLVLGEFRRHVRGLLIGPNAGAPPAHENFLLRGFEVEPSTVPDAIVTVRLDPGGGGPLGFAIGSELIGTPAVGPYDFGQLIGGDDSASSLEGNASQTLDFSGEPAATYTVQMRFSYSDGVSDNRAFWDEATTTEFIATTNTRHLPVFELRLSGTASEEWIDLASVVWDGISIDAADITDLRVFTMEGVSPFQQTTQDGTGGMADFSRSTARGDDAVGRNEVFPVLRALGRQIQDIKGPDGSGDWDWFSRPLAPYDPLALRAIELTKTLSSVDTVTYTVGDGVSIWGDFNGAAGLEECLQHIEDSGLSTPRHARVLIRSHRASPLTFTITTAHTFNAALEHLTIDCGGQSISCTHPAASVALEMGDEEAICEVNSAKDITLTNNATFIDGTGVRGCIVRMDGVVLTGDTSNTAADLISILDRSIIRNCELSGRIDIQPRLEDPGGVIDQDSLRAIVFEHCAITGGIDLNDVATNPSFRTHLKLIDCRLYSADIGLGSVVSVAGQWGFTMNDCVVRFNPDFHGVSIFDASGHTPRNCQIKDSQFYTSGTPATGGMYAVNLDAVDGVQIKGCTFDIFDEEAGGIQIGGGSNNVTIGKCDFDGSAGSARATALLSAIYFESDASRVKVLGCTFKDWETNTGVGNGRAIQASATADLVQLTVDSSSFTSCGGHCIQLGDSNSCDLLVLSHNSVNVPEVNGAGFDIEGTTRGAITGNTMFFTTASSAALTGGAGAGDCVASGNRFHNGLIPATGMTIYGSATATLLNYIT